MMRLGFLAAVVAALWAHIASAAPLEAYGKLPSIESATISPNGRAVAVVVTNGEDRTIVVKDLKSDAITLRGFLGAHKIRSVSWAGDEHLAVVYSATFNTFEIDNGFREWFFGSTINLKTKTIAPMMRNSQKADLGAIFGYPIVRNYMGEPAIFVQGVVFSGGYGHLSLFRIDLKTGTNRLVEAGATNTIDWTMDTEGRAIAQELYEPASGEWTLKVRSGTGWRDAVSYTEKVDRPYLIGLGRDNTSVIYAARDKDDRWAWREARVNGDNSGAPLATLDNQAAIRAPLDGRMIGHYALVGDEARYTFFDPVDARAWKAIVETFPDRQVRLESWSADRRKVVVLADSPTDGPAFAVVDLSDWSATWLGAEYADLETADIALREPIRFTAGDGLPLTGYLTTPRGRDAKNLPLVVFVHGGPAARDEPGFDWWAQAMASRGYAVLQVNYRGSDGFGWKFLSAGFGEWGRKMQTDLSDGVRYLASKGTIDPKRVCIVGGSYGGYAALAGAALDRGVYRCAASFGGVSDLRRLITYSRGKQGLPAQRYWTRFMGADDLKDPVLAQYSPVTHAAEVAIPVLLVHGRDDTVVPLEQSQVMADALQKAGKPVELVVQKGADHWLSRGDTRMAMLRAVTTFLEKHNPPN